MRSRAEPKGRGLVCGKERQACRGFMQRWTLADWALAGMQGARERKANLEWPERAKQKLGQAILGRWSRLAWQWSTGLLKENRPRARAALTCFRAYKRVKIGPNSGPWA